MRNKIIVGVHTFYHDGSIATYNLDTKEFKYLKFERITGIKEQFHNNFNSWKEYLIYLGYSTNDILDVFFVHADEIEKRRKDLHLVDHHVAHHYSAFNNNTIVIDDIGSQKDVLSIFKQNDLVEKLKTHKNYSLGKTLQFLWGLWFTHNYEGVKSSHAGHCMALAAFGKNYSNNIGEQLKETSMERFQKFCNTFHNLTYQENCNNYVNSLHFYWYKKIKNILENHFQKNDIIHASGGVTENIILNTLIKKDFPNYEPIPHCGDEGSSIGALIYGLKNFYKIDFKIDQNKIYQNDENFGYAKEVTIQKVAELLHQGKLVMWGQGWGEVGPRALGYRSILMNPCTPNAKQIINDKIKKRIWFRPYGASVPYDRCDKYFDLEHKSPYMLYQALVKDPVTFYNITHADGTCRIQTVEKENPLYELLKEFEKLSGYPILINTSMNLPGKPIVGTKKQAKIMFDNSQADVLVMGDEIYTK